MLSESDKEKNLRDFEEVKPWNFGIVETTKQENEVENEEQDEMYLLVVDILSLTKRMFRVIQVDCHSCSWIFHSKYQKLELWRQGFLWLFQQREHAKNS